MPDPVWTLQYNFSQTPESNSFTRIEYGAPTINVVTGGGPSNRRVEIDSSTGDCVFVSSTVPALDSDVGATAEFQVNVSGAANGDAGIELTFLNRAVLLQVYPNQLIMTLTGDLGTEEHIVATDSNNADILWRMTYSGNSTNEIRVYRAGTLIAGPYNPPVAAKPFQRVLWWGEGGAVCVFRALKYYLGGAVVPG